MPYLVDGHNLIPKAGLRLDAPNDEMDLVTMLQEFSRTSRAAVEVYFDGAPPGQAGAKRFGIVMAHFVQRGIDRRCGHHGPPASAGTCRQELDGREFRPARSGKQP